MPRRVWAIVKYPDGRIQKELVSFKGAEKVERKMIQDTDSKLWLYKNRYEYMDKKAKDESGAN